MKYLISTVFALLVANMVIAQVPASVSEGSAEYPDLSSSFSITISGVDKDFVEDSWRKFIEIQDGTTGQVFKNQDGDEIKSLGVLFPPLEYERVDILALVQPVPSTEDDTVVLLRIWILREDNTVLSPDLVDETAQRVKNWLFAFDSQLDRNNFSKD